MAVGLVVHQPGGLGRLARLGCLLLAKHGVGVYKAVALPHSALNLVSVK